MSRDQTISASGGGGAGAKRDGRHPATPPTCPHASPAMPASSSHPVWSSSAAIRAPSAQRYEPLRMLNGALSAAARSSLLHPWAIGWGLCTARERRAGPRWESQRVRGSEAQLPCRLRAARRGGPSSAIPRCDRRGRGRSARGDGWSSKASACCTGPREYNRYNSTWLASCHLPSCRTPGMGAPHDPGPPCWVDPHPAVYSSPCLTV